MLSQGYLVFPDSNGSLVGSASCIEEKTLIRTAGTRYPSVIAGGSRNFTRSGEEIVDARRRTSIETVFLDLRTVGEVIMYVRAQIKPATPKEKT